MDLKQLRDEAAKVRQAIETTERDEMRAGNLALFPTECCDHAMKLLALHLSLLGFTGLSKARGERRFGEVPRYHIWLVCQGVILDITADQFDEGQAQVIVTRRSRWHEAWNPELEPIDEELLALWPGADGVFFDVYCEILGKLSPGGRRSRRARH
jgi:hypothetical protein